MYASGSRTLDLDAIVVAAVDLIEDKGLGGLTMRGLAKRLGCSPMALYRHVADKQELIGAVSDHYLGDLALPDTDGLSWQQTIVDVTTAVHSAFLAHPPLEAILGIRHVDTLAVFRADEVILRALIGAGLPGRDAVHALDVLASYAVGATQRKAAVRAGSPREGARLQRLRQLPAEDFPTVIELAGELVTIDLKHDFEDGLRLVIDGIEARLRLVQGDA
jgi:TetR/AcrR family tetracycline transcriptional repressor